MSCSCSSQPADTAPPLPPTAPPTPGLAYVIGRVEMRSPSVAVERELAQSSARIDSAGLTAGQVARRVLSARSNRHLLRSLRWVLIVQGQEAYTLYPRDPADFDLLLETLRPEPTADALDLVVGVVAPAPEGRTAALLFDQLHSFERSTLVAALPRAEGVSDAELRAAAKELLDHLLRITDNAGTADEHRALNYLAVRYPPIYETTAAMLAKESPLTAVEVKPSRLSGARRVLQIVFTYTSRRTDVAERLFVQVDVTELFPFVVTKLQPYLDLP